MEKLERIFWELDLNGTSKFFSLWQLKYFPLDFETFWRSIWGWELDKNTTVSRWPFQTIHSLLIWPQFQQDYNISTITFLLLHLWHPLLSVRCNYHIHSKQLLSLHHTNLILHHPFHHSIPWHSLPHFFLPLLISPPVSGTCLHWQIDFWWHQKGQLHICPIHTSSTATWRLPI